MSLLPTCPLIPFFRNLFYIIFAIRLPRWLSGKESACPCRRCKFNPWVGKIPWSRNGQPAPVFLPGKFHRPRSPVGYSPWGHKESDTTEYTHTHATTTKVSDMNDYHEVISYKQSHHILTTFMKYNIGKLKENIIEEVDETNDGKPMH